MKKSIFLTAWFVTASFYILIFQASGFAWQGRMAGTGDAYGLVEDESDYLIHPAAIASGKETNFYGSYRLTYDYISQWDNKTGIPSEDKYYPFKADGHEWKNEGLAGLAFPAGTGRMGLFFEYIGKRGSYDGDENNYGNIPSDLEFNVENKADDFKLRAIYGRPFGGIKLGCELQFSHIGEETNDIINNGRRKNVFIIVDTSPAFDLYAYMIPYNSDYYVSQGKLSIEGKTDILKNSLSLKGGSVLPFGSNNSYNSKKNNTDEVRMRGEVQGWNVNCDYWARFFLSKDISLPLTVGAGHTYIERDGAGDSNYATRVNYKHRTEETNVIAGGGADFNLNKSVIIAAGIYYSYLQSTQDMNVKDRFASATVTYDYPHYPQRKENRITLKAMTQINLSPNLAFLSGLNVFYGKVDNNYFSKLTSSNSSAALIENDITTKGYNWGCNISFGTDYKTGNISIEPFINAGFNKLKIDGKGEYNAPFISSYNSCIGESEKTDWIIGGGLSVRY